MKDGKPVARETEAIIWGEPGTNGQHSFYQLIHQGTKLIPVDFLGFANSLNPVGDHHTLLMSNVFAQAAALAFGKTLDEVLAEGTSPELAPHKVFQGNRPSSVLLMDQLSPRTLGRLLALYEHETETKSFIWGINAFDQWGVELGKVLANRISPVLAGTQTGTFDSSTTRLIELFKKLRSRSASAVVAIVAVGWGSLWATASSAATPGFVKATAVSAASHPAALGDVFHLIGQGIVGAALIVIGSLLLQKGLKAYSRYAGERSDAKKLSMDAAEFNAKVAADPRLPKLLNGLHVIQQAPTRILPSLAFFRAMGQVFTLKQQRAMADLLEEKNIAIITAA
jgi:hypothetical protein